MHRTPTGPARFLTLRFVALAAIIGTTVGFTGWHFAHTPTVAFFWKQEFPDVSGDSESSWLQRQPTRGRLAGMREGCLYAVQLAWGEPRIVEANGAFDFGDRLAYRSYLAIGIVTGPGWAADSWPSVEWIDRWSPLTFSPFPPTIQLPIHDLVSVSVRRADHPADALIGILSSDSRTAPLGSTASLLLHGHEPQLLIAQGTSGAFVTRILDLDDPAWRRKLVLDLPTTRSQYVRFMNAHDEPLANVTIQPTTYQGFRVHPHCELLSMTTDTHGKTTLLQLEPDVYEVRVWRGGGLPITTELDLRNAGHMIRLPVDEAAL